MIVQCTLCVCVTKIVLSRDAALATEFVNSLKKVGPSLGMTVGAPKEFKLTDNRPATYVQTLDQVLKMGPSIVMVVIPNNKVPDPFLSFLEYFL